MLNCMRVNKYVIAVHCIGRLWKFKKDEVDELMKAGGAADRNRKGSDE